MVNRLKKLSPQFRRALKSVSTLSRSLNYKVYLVGGVARDLVLKKKVFDLDMVVEGDAIKLATKLAKQLKGEFRRHHSFGTATVSWQGHKIDFVRARSESYAHWGALPKVKPAHLAEDLLRRDFTINAMAISLNRSDYGKLIDLYGGLPDLKKGFIRILYDQSFLEDPTRILRAIRFQQRFKFRFQPQTLKLLKAALRKKALNLVNPHRLRNELILILKESKPYGYIKRLNQLEKFSFVDKGLRLKGKDFKLLLAIEKTLEHYQRNFKKPRQLEAWTIYLAGILVNFSLKKIKVILHNFGFKKGERIIVISIKKDLAKIKKLDSKLKSKAIHQILDQYSLEAILFFYAYYPKIKLRKNIEYFLNELIHSRIQLKGRDLKELGFAPPVLYGKILKTLSYAKFSKSLNTKDDEVKEARRIFKRLRRK